MPNWCSNKVKIEGDKNEIEAIKAKLADEKEHTLFSFQNIIPMPDELNISATFMDKDNDPELYKKQAANIAKYGYKDWYDWRNANWGTKWDASDVYLEEFENEPEPGKKTLCYYFDTAWSFPDPIADELSRRFPKLTFDWIAEEEAMMFKPFREVQKNGIVTYYTEFKNNEDAEDFWDKQYRVFGDK